MSLTVNVLHVFAVAVIYRLVVKNCKFPAGFIIRLRKIKPDIAQKAVIGRLFKHLIAHKFFFQF